MKLPSLNILSKWLIKNLVFVFVKLWFCCATVPGRIWRPYLQILSIRYAVVSTCTLGFPENSFTTWALWCFVSVFIWKCLSLCIYLGLVFYLLFCLYFVEPYILSCFSCILSPGIFLYINFLSVLILPSMNVLTPLLFPTCWFALLFVGASTFFDVYPI